MFDALQTDPNRAIPAQQVFDAVRARHADRDGKKSASPAAIAEEAQKTMEFERITVDPAVPHPSKPKVGLLGTPFHRQALHPRASLSGVSPAWTLSCGRVSGEHSQGLPVP